MQYNETLFSLQGQVARARTGGSGAGIDPTLINNFLNQRQRVVLNMRPYWSGLIGRGVLNVPAAQSFSNIQVIQGSAVAFGTNEGWPYNDVVNTTLTQAIINPGYQVAVPAFMNGITNDTLLLIDSGLSTAEIVPVLEVTPTQFKASFTYTHPAGAAVYCSSLSYQQFVVGYMYPIYTIKGVLGTNLSGVQELVLDQPWAGASITNTTITIRKSYYTFATDLKDFVSVVDPQQGLSLTLHYPREQIDWDDPQRSAVDWPSYVVDYSANLNNNMQWELWPPPGSQRQLYYTYIREWPQMVANTDRPPSFIDPSILVYGALADAWKVKLPGENPNGNLQYAQMWEAKFQEAVIWAMTADNGKRQAAYTWPPGGMGYPGGANFAQSHDWGVWSQDY